MDYLTFRNGFDFRAIVVLRSHNDAMFLKWNNALS